ncbi:response regulator [Sphingomonas sp. RS2018]
MLFGKKERHIVRVLIVEDEPLVAFDTEHFLEAEGYEIVGTVDTVAEAMAALEAEEDIHLVLADVNLSDGNGIDVAQAAHARGIKVVFVTGSCPIEAQSIAAGCLSKPYAPRDLIAAIGAIEQVIGGKAPRRLPASFRLFLQPA